MALDSKEPELHLLLDGESVEMEVLNVVGPACEALSRPFAKLFQIDSVRKKPEYDQQRTEQGQRQRQGGP